MSSSKGDLPLRGVGRSHAAISVVNAIPSGRGGGIGIELPVSVKIKLISKLEYRINGKETKKHLACITALEFLQFYNKEFGFELTVKSKIPIAKGLKSSSAIQVATAQAVINALGENVPNQEKFLQLLVNAARTANVTITGGLDDLASCAFGGIVLTDNSSNKILLQKEIEEKSVVLIIPKKSIFTANLKFQRSDIISKLFNKIHDIAFKDPYLALTLNGLLFMELTDLDTTAIRVLLREPVIAIGLSGKGPAIAIICDQQDIPNIKSIAMQYGTVILTRTTNQGIHQ